ncbi:MAG: Nif11-like leader peptide family natural product precursor [Cyanobacteriota bacterium]|nr:Nif11-like leader peptide family natural product precursor [Cyanobacteriota bacterium]
MSQANLDRFLDEARRNLALSDKVRAARSHDELVRLAAEHGHQVSKPSLVRHHLHRLAGRSDDELEAMSENLFDHDFGDVFLGKLI